MAKMPWPRKVSDEEKRRLTIQIVLATPLFGIGAANGSVLFAWLLLICWVAFIGHWFGLFGLTATSMSDKRIKKAGRALPASSNSPAEQTGECSSYARKT